MSSAPSPQLTAMLRQEFQLIGLAAPSAAGVPGRAALHRAEFVQQVIYALYDETKFRLGDRSELESLCRVSDAAMEFVAGIAGSG